MACKTISSLINRAGYDGCNNHDERSNGYGVNNNNKTAGIGGIYDGRYYSMKKLDKLSTNVLKNALKFTGTVKMMVHEAKENRCCSDSATSSSSATAMTDGEHQPDILIAQDNYNLALLDPLDGSGNADASTYLALRKEINSKRFIVKV